MSESMVERVANAIKRADAEESLEAGEDNPGYFDRMARAAIEVMREPTDHMMEVYKRAFVSEKRFDGRKVYGVMIDAALTPAKVDEADDPHPT